MNRLTFITPSLWLLCSVFCSLLPSTRAVAEDEEQDIRLAYARYTFSSQLHSVNTAIGTTKAGEVLDDASLKRALSRGTATFQLSAFQSIPASKLTPAITDALLTSPSRYEAEQIKIGSSTQEVSEGPERFLIETEVDSSWGMSGDPDTGLHSLTQKLEDHEYPWLQEVITFTVTATLDGKSKTYMAFAVTGVDKNKTRQLRILDPFTERVDMLVVSPDNHEYDVYPILMLSTMTYDTEAGRNFLREMSIPRENCRAGGCCLNNTRCGVSSEDVNRRLSVPIKNPAIVQAKPIVSSCVKSDFIGSTPLQRLAPFEAAPSLSGSYR